MTKTKLTVLVDRNLLENIKRYADNNNTTITDLIDTYFRHILAQAPFDNAPIVQRLSGTISKDVSLPDYKKYLDEKYAQ